MHDARFLTRAMSEGKVTSDEVSSLTDVARQPARAQADLEVLEGGDNRRQAGPPSAMSPQAAAVLPAMIALARLQARRSLAEQDQ